MRAIRSILMLAGLTSTAAAHASPETAVADFYSWRIASKVSGAPSPAEQVVLRPLVTKELHCLLGAAWTLMDAAHKKFPNEKPPYVEGDLFSSSFEGPTSFKVLHVTSTGPTRAVAQVRLTYQDKHTRPSHWRDKVYLQLEDGRWRVADVDRNAGFAFGQSGSLLRNLSANVLEPEPLTGYPGAQACKAAP